MRTTSNPPGDSKDEPLRERAIAALANRQHGLATTEQLVGIGLSRNGIAKPLVNVVVEGEEVDAHWPDRRLIVEVEGDGHQRPNVKRNDARRDRLLAAAAWRVVRIDADEVRLRPKGVLHTLARVGLQG